MSKNLKALLTALNVENPDELIDSLTGEEETPAIVQSLLKKAQEYARPFVEAELNENFNGERKTLKGKYFKDAIQKVNRKFGSKLTNSEIDRIMSLPENEGKTFDAVIDEIYSKNTDSGTEAELKKMLDTANGKLSDYEQKMLDMEAKHKADFDNYVKTGKLTATLKGKLVKILQARTSMNAEKAAELLQEPLMKRALVKLNDSDEIDLFDPSKPDSRLRRSETEFETLDGVVSKLADEYELPKIASGGASGGQSPANNANEQKKEITFGATAGANKIAEAFANAPME